MLLRKLRLSLTLWGESNKMSKQTPSRDFHFEFEHTWGGTPSEVQQFENWGKKQKGVVRWITLNFLLPWYAKWWLDYKLEREMGFPLTSKQQTLFNNGMKKKKPKRRPIMETKPSEVEGLDDISLRYSWLDQISGIRDHLKFLRKLKRDLIRQAQRDTLPDPTLEDPWEEETKEK